MVMITAHDATDVWQVQGACSWSDGWNLWQHSGRGRLPQLPEGPIGSASGREQVQLHTYLRAGPPVGAFWSITMYDRKTQFLVENPLNRYLINSIMFPELKKNADGGITLYFQHKSPGADLESNWLPAPDGTMGVVMRLYMPKPEVLSGAWVAPPIRTVGPA